MPNQSHHKEKKGKTNGRLFSQCCQLLDAYPSIQRFIHIVKSMLPSFFRAFLLSAQSVKR
uniref:Uncharacterized protein n=1 Tax=Arundo donax TaxID=35708 RepID=A0A0A8XQF5_ARUDO